MILKHNDSWEIGPDISLYAHVFCLHRQQLNMWLSFVMYPANNKGHHPPMGPIDPMTKLRAVIRLLIPGGQLFDVLLYMVILNTPRAGPDVYDPNSHFSPLTMEYCCV